MVSYIEEHCLVFDNEEENKLEYTTIHMVSCDLTRAQVCTQSGKSETGAILKVEDKNRARRLKHLSLFHAVSDLVFCFQNFFRLVDELLCELVAEMGITREQFKAACESSANNATHSRIVQ